jgi:hypothetical protein
MKHPRLDGVDPQARSRARRRALLDGRDALTRADLEAVLAGFLPSSQGMEREYQ